MSDLDITGRVSMDASQAERALENLSAQAGKMSVDMAKAGDATRKAVEKIGDISTANGEKFTKSEGTIVNSIKRLAAEAAKAQPQASRPAPSTNPEQDRPQAGEAATDQRVDEPVSVAGEETASTVPEVAGQETESVPAGA